MHALFWWGSVKERERLEGFCSVKVRLKDTGWEGHDWIDLAQVRGTWWAVVNSNVRGIL